MEPISTPIDQLAGAVAWLLDFEGLLWLALFVGLLLRPPMLRDMRAALRAEHDLRYRHWLNLTRFRTELVRRQDARGAGAGSGRGPGAS